MKKLLLLSLILFSNLTNLFSQVTYNGIINDSPVILTFKNSLDNYKMYNEYKRSAKFNVVGLSGQVFLDIWIYSSDYLALYSNIKDPNRPKENIVIKLTDISKQFGKSKNTILIGNIHQKDNPTEKTQVVFIKN